MLKRLLVLTLAAALLASAACGGDDKDGGGSNNNGTPNVPTAVPTQTPPPQSTTGTVVLGGDTYAVGSSVQLTGANWLGTGPITFYLLNADQLDDPVRAVVNGEAPKVGEATPDGSGQYSFDFVLESSFTTEGGTPFAVQSGEEFTVFGLQNSIGSLSESFTVS